MKLNYKYILLASAVVLVSCNEDEVLADWKETNPEPTAVVPTGDSGDADLSNLVVLGTSLAAGFQDGALYTEGQANSFPALLGAQFQISGIGGTTSFGQPDINSENGFNMLLGDPALGRTVLDLSLLAPVPTAGDLNSILTPWSGTTSSLNNFGIPLTTAVQLLTPATGGPVTQSYGGSVPDANNPAYNPFYRRFASSPSTNGADGSSPLMDAASAGGTFFVFEAGINDVTLYAAGGGSNAIGPLTNAAAFEGYIDAAIQTLASSGASREDAGAPSFNMEGVVLNIPPILVFPYFQAVGHDLIPMDQATADGTNSAYQSYNDGLDLATACGIITATENAQRKISFSAITNNPVVIEDESLTQIVIPQDCAGPGVPSQNTPLPNYRMATENDIIVLLAATQIGELANPMDPTSVIGVGVPLPDQLVLVPAEQLEIETARAQFNAALAGAVSDVNASGGDVVLVDIESIFLDAAGLSDGEIGIRTQGLTLSPDFAPNGIFSTDGIHPCQRGHGLVANAIIDAINANWGASIPSITIAPLGPPPFQP